jgi:hypothetical protein
MRSSCRLICVSAIFFGCMKPPENPAAKIDASRIKSIRAKISFSPDDGPTIDAFEAAPEDFARLLALIKDGVAEPVAATNWMPFGEMKLTTDDINVTTVDVYWTGASNGAFRVNGRPVRGSSDKAFRDTITECASRGKRS